MINHHLCLLLNLYVFSVLFLLLNFNKVSGTQTFQASTTRIENIDNMQNDNSDVVLADTFQNYIVSNRFCDEIACKDKYEAAGYPYKKILEAVSNPTLNIATRPIRPVGKMNTEYSNPMGLRGDTDKSNSGVPILFSRTSATICKEVYSRLYPITGRGVDGKKYYIINVKGFQQITDIVMCHKNGISCGDKSTEPENYTYHCVQQYEMVSLSTFPIGKNITVEDQSLKTFKVPKGCTCERIRLRDTMM